MPAKYTLVLRKDMRKGAAEGSKLFYANAKAAGTCGMYELCDLISLSSTASPGDVRLILDSLIEVMKRSLGKGEVVQVGELGNFQLQFGSTGTTTKKEFNQALIKSKRGPISTIASWHFSVKYWESIAGQARPIPILCSD